MKKLWLLIRNYFLEIWRSISLCIPPILYTLFFSLLPLIVTVILTVLIDGNWWPCCAENIKNGELFLVSMSFIASSWFIMMEIQKHPKGTFRGMPITTLLAIIIIAVSICCVVEQRLHNNFKEIEMISIISTTTLFLSCFVYARCISFKVKMEDMHSETEQKMFNEVSKRIRGE